MWKTPTRSKNLYSPVPHNRGRGGILVTGGFDRYPQYKQTRGRGPNKKGGGSEKCSWSKVETRPVVTNYGCTKQLLIAKYQYNFSCILHLYVKQRFNVSPSLLLFWCLVSFLFKKNERTYILGKDEIKTDNWLKLFELNCLQFYKQNNNNPNKKWESDKK